MDDTSFRRIMIAITAMCTVNNFSGNFVGVEMMYPYAE